MSEKGENTENFNSVARKKAFIGFISGITIAAGSAANDMGHGITMGAIITLLSIGYSFKQIQKDIKSGALNVDAKATSPNDISQLNHD